MSTTDDTHRVHFTLSFPPSEASSRAASPLLSVDDDFNYSNESDDGDVNYSKNSNHNFKSNLKSKLSTLNTEADGDESDGDKGDVYDTTLPWWRAAVRRRLVRAVRVESEVIARMQKLIRTPWLDAYFVYTSSLGTHTFFMIILPSLFFFGYDEMGRGLLIILALGVYFSSVIKDLLCSPRPFAPPVTRLTIGSHHLEYGFPSTHSTNSISIALFFYSHVHALAYPATVSNSTTTPEASISHPTYLALTALLCTYAFSIVFGRLYTAMHSFTDVAMGVALGAGIWWAHSSFAGVPVYVTAEVGGWVGWVVEVVGGVGTVVPVVNAITQSVTDSSSTTPTPTITHLIHILSAPSLGARSEAWIRTGGWIVPGLVVPATLLAIHVHPQPVDDCPCFEDAIAFVSVVMGAVVGRWGVGKVYGGGVEGVGGMGGVGGGGNGYGGGGAGGMGGLQRPVVVMPGSGWVLDAAMGWVQVERGWDDVFVWWGMAALKMVVGILIIFTWRILAKRVLHAILPPIFRSVAKITGALPNRRFYTPATEYYAYAYGGEGGGGDENDAVNATSIVNGNANANADEKSRNANGHANSNGHINDPTHTSTSTSSGLHPIPSVIELMGPGSMREEVGGIGSGVESVGVGYGANGGVRGNGMGRGSGKGIKLRYNEKYVKMGDRDDRDEKYDRDEKEDEKYTNKTPHGVTKDEETASDERPKEIKHYDVDVLTKFVVYAGIAILASEVIPLMFDLLGWGTKSWV